MSAVLEQRLAEQRAMVLWAVDALGPDEILPMVDYDAAVAYAAAANAALHGGEREVPDGVADVLCLCVVVPWHYGGHETPGSQLGLPIGTVTTQDHHALVATHLTKFYGTSTGQPAAEPLGAVTAGGWKFGEVRAFLTRYNGVGDGQPLQLPLGTVTTRDRFGLVQVHGESFAIADIGMRMLSPRELFRAQGFPDDYRIDIEHRGKRLTKTAQVRMAGNSVCPAVAAAIVAANVRGEEAVAA